MTSSNSSHSSSAELTREVDIDGEDLGADPPTRRSAPDELDSDAVTRVDGETTKGPAIERGATLGRYVVLGPLGAGGMGVVYLAYDPELDRRVALKLIRSPHGATDDDVSRSLRSRLLREAQALAKLRHSNVITVYDVGTMDDAIFIAMEYVQGRTWREVCAAQSPSQQQRWSAVVSIALDAGRGLAAAHRAGLVHRDFKLDNVIVDNEGHAFVLDFGLAHAQRGPTPSDAFDSSSASVDQTSVDSSAEPTGSAFGHELTQAGSIVGTPAYMAPEQFAGTADARSDQFSFCVALYCALYGQRPFRGTGMRGQHAAVARGLDRLPDAPPVPAHVRAVLMRGLSADPARRFASMDDLLVELGRDPWARRKRVLAGSGVALAIAAGTIAYVERADDELVQCLAGADRIDATWHKARAEAIERAFGDLHTPFARQAWASSRAMLDAYVTSWRDAYDEACRATYERAQQSATLLDLRMACLDDRLIELVAVLDVVADPDERTAHKVVNAVYDLRRVERCRDRKALLATVPLPDDPQLRAQVEGLSEELVKVRASVYSDAFESVGARTSTLLEWAEPLDYGPLSSELHYVLAFHLIDKGRPGEAREHLLRATYEAERVGAFELAAEAAIARLWTDAYMARDHAAAAELELHAEALVQAAGSSAELGAKLAYGRGAVAAGRDDLAACEAHLLDALELGQEVFEPANPRLTRMRLALATCALAPTAQKNAEATRMLREAEARLRETFSDVHPDLALAVSNLSNTALVGGRYREAVEEAERSNELWRALGQQDDSHARYGYFTQAQAQVAWGRPREALARLAEFDAVVMADDFDCSQPFTAQGIAPLVDANVMIGRVDTAMTLVERTLAACERHLGAEHADVATVQLALATAALATGAIETAREQLAALRGKSVEAKSTADGGHAVERLAARVALASGDATAALTHLDAAERAGVAYYGVAHPALGDDWHLRGLASVVAGDLDRGRQSLERAWQTFVSIDTQHPRAVVVAIDRAELELAQAQPDEASRWVSRARGALVSDRVSEREVDRLVALERELGQ